MQGGFIMGKLLKQIATFQDLKDTFGVSISESQKNKLVTYKELKALGLVAVNQGTGPASSSSEPIYNSSQPTPPTNYKDNQGVIFNDILRRLTNVAFSIERDIRIPDFNLVFNPQLYPGELVFNFDIICYPTFTYCKDIRDWPQYDSSMEYVNIDSPDYGTKTFYRTISLYDGDPAKTKYSLISDLSCVYTGANSNWTWNGSEYVRMTWGAVKINPYITQAEQGTKRFCFDNSEYRSAFVKGDI